MAITIQKPVDKEYLLKQLEAFDRYALFDKFTRTVLKTPEQYIAVTATDPGAELIVDDSVVVPGAGEVGLSDVDALMGVGTFAVGQYVFHQIAVYEDQEYYRHRYRKLSETFEWLPNNKYFTGNIVTHDGCLYKANKNNESSTWIADNWDMVGAKSILQLVDELPDVTTLKTDMLFVLKTDEMDTGVTPATVKNPKGLYLFDKTSETYSQIDLREDKDLDFAEIFDDTKTSTYKGGDKIVNSDYLYEQIADVAGTLNERIDDLYDITKDAQYIIVEDDTELKAYDLDTLTDNTMNIFLVKEDHDHLVDPSDPYSDPTATLYGCVAVEKKSDRKLDYIGQLSMSNTATKKLIQDMIDKEVKIETPAHYEVCASGDEGAKEVVANGTIATIIEASNVAPIVTGTTTNVGDIVFTTTAYQTGTALTVVADGTTPLAANEVEVSTVNAKLVDGEVAFSVGDTVDSVIAYENALSGLTIKDDGYTSTVIEEGSVSPVLAGTTIAVGDYVKKVEAVITSEYKFLEKKDYDTATLKKVSHNEVTYTDTEGTDPDVKVDYLTYDSKKILFHDFENVDIDFDEEYDPIVEE